MAALKCKYLYLLVCSYVHVQGQPTEDAESVIKFNRDYVIVYYDPFVAYTDKSVKNAYNESQILQQLKTISTRFSKIIIRIDDAESDESAYTQIPVAAAKFNRDYGHTIEQPLEVYISISHEDNDIFDTVDKVKNMADAANTIYDGTVQEILYTYDNLNNITAEFAVRKLAYAQTKLNTSDFPYKLGAVVYYADYCFQQSLKTAAPFLKIFPFLHSIFMVLVISHEGYDQGQDASFKFINQAMKSCKLKSEELNFQNNIGFYTLWADTNYIRGQNASNLVEYWKSTGTWAERHQTRVVMVGAFDNPAAFNFQKQAGWWTLDVDGIYNSPSDYIYLEKQMLSKSTNKSESDDANEETDSTTDIFIIIVSVGLVLFVSVFVLAMYIIVKRKVESKLTAEELQDFFDGGDHLLDNQLSREMPRVGYNKGLEISPRSFKIDQHKLLGTGAFCEVYRGTITVKGKTQDVATKKTKSMCPSTALTGILSEIKVLSYLGQHENIVSIIGAYTKQLRKGKVFLFIELCPLGSLDKYLRLIQEQSTTTEARVNIDIESAAVTFIPEPVQSSIIEQAETEILSNDQRSDLQRWSLEIANGMSFLASKRLIHGDLATRNVLLTENRTAKISDFGLSRRLYNYEDYVKKQQEPLPWRWMPPESLRTMTFNEKTDVWAFGVTLWEIFTLGDKPYAGLSWTDNFISMLEKGLQLGQPTHCSEHTYSIIQKCCKANPLERPSFSELKEMLKELLTYNL